MTGKGNEPVGVFLTWRMFGNEVYCGIWTYILPLVYPFLLI